MKKKIIFISLLFTSLSYTAISQDEKSNTIEEQFTNLIENSNSYQSFKVIDISKLGVLRSNIKDTISTYKSTIVKSESTVLEQRNKLDSATNQIEELNTQLEETKKNVENIDFVGISTQKTIYNTIMWGIVTVLFLLSIIFFIVFKKGQSTTKAARLKLEETENELNSLRKRSLEREQKIRRELQDELNKNKL